LPERKKKILSKLMLKVVLPGSTVFSKRFKFKNCIKAQKELFTVNKTIKDPEVTANAVEETWN